MNDRISYDTGVSSSVQSDIQATIGRLETLIAAREKDVAAAMADFQADGVSDEYHAVEQRWKNAAGEVKNIIHLVKQTLGLNDDTASGAGHRARTAVSNIG
ncbi:pore-forming ESAT-6 family protein [Tersicoccus sp. MR15.9]|uniref:pore-forming ESAT-6 family protein n=1 Tax=Tersicoccus mangrovi TaxID=3121635 RepID=UPI002FE58041